MSTVQILPRSAWTSTPRPGGLVPLDAGDVRGLALHWPGTTAPIGPASQTSIAARLEGYRRDHVNDRGWADIAYQAAVDQAGRIWDLRGLAYRSAANGDTVPNRDWGAVVVLVGPGEALTPACLAALRHLWRALWLARWPHATRLVEHRDVRPEPTECPGPAVRAAIDSGAITHPAAPTLLEEIMSTPQERAAFAAEVAQARVRLEDWVADWVGVDHGTAMSLHELGQQSFANAARGRRMLGQLATSIATELDDLETALQQLRAGGLDAAAAQALADAIAAQVDRVKVIVQTAAADADGP